MTIDNIMSDEKSGKVACLGWNSFHLKELHKATSNTTVIWSFFWDRYTMINVFGMEPQVSLITSLSSVSDVFL